ncbi:MAG: radical SAM protein [Deltaproteobacteria bacterium]|nr:radical SAM protein [Deltaproteobacteria bacterium]MBW1792943.1 radical SAM protein [Deltaproteobacteria bacterium]MBW2330516.1 radical SAM protein [Deltaproteobacteria bacterium]
MMMKHFVYGPVPSRRLGRSLGVDLVPYKVCSYDCIYCQLGRTKEKTIERKPYIAVERILEQLCQKLKEGARADYITVAGSGEPTLNSQTGALIHDIKKHTEIPVAVLTNGSLLGDSEVRESIMEADVVLPSLDAHDQEGFETINRPHPEIKFETMVEGLIDFRKKYPGEIWLEVFILDGINATEADAIQFKHWIERVNPQKIHINTAVRPSAETYARQVSPEKMSRFCKILGEKAEVIAPYKDLEKHERRADVEEDLLDLLARRPCTLDDISSGLSVHKNEILKYIGALVKNHTIEMVKKDSLVYYQRGPDKRNKKI